MFRIGAIITLAVGLASSGLLQRVAAQPVPLERIEQLAILCENDAGANCVAEALKLYENDHRAMLKAFSFGCARKMAFACANFGVMYANGVGIVKSFSSANQHFEKACDLGSMPGCYLRGLSHGYGLGGAKNDALALKYHTQACNSDYAPACNSVGVLLKSGIGIDHDIAAAKTAYEKSCKGGYALGCASLGAGYETGAWGPVDLVKAKALLGQACEAGDKVSCTHLSMTAARERFLTSDVNVDRPEATSVINLYDVTFTYGVPPWVSGTANILKEVKPYRSQKGDDFIYELIPADESFENWSTLFAVSAMRNNRSVPVTTWRDYGLDLMRTSCQGYRELTYLVNENVALLQVFCPRVKGMPMKGYEGGMGEIGLFAFIVHDTILIKHYVEWRGQAFDIDNPLEWPVEQSEIDKVLTSMKLVTATTPKLTIKLFNQ